MIRNNDLASVLKRNNVATCSYTYFEETNQISVSIVLKSVTTPDKYKEELASYFHDRGISQVDFSYAFLENQKPGVVYENLNSTLLYTTYHGVINGARFDEICSSLSREKGMEY